MAALSGPNNTRVGYPRKGIIAVGGFTRQGLPIVILQDMETGAVFHAQRRERKYDFLFGR